MDTRELKGMQIAATMPIRRTTYGWLVPSQSSPTTNYKVASDHPKIDTLPILSGLTCTCPDYELRGQACKHVIAVEMTVKRETAPDGTVTEEVKVTYTQEWSSYNAAQCSEKDRFMPMLADLCSTISNPPQGKGRPRLPRSDMAFNCIARIYSGLSARRADSDVREANGKGLTDSDAHFNSVLRYLRDPEMTPILRGLVEMSALPLKAIETDFAADSTGFTTSRFVRWYDHKWGKEQTKREWVKLHAMTGVRTNVVTAVELTDYKANDYPQFIPLAETTARNFELRDVTADKAYSGRTNLQAVEDLGGNAFIPFKAHRTAGPVPAVQGIMPNIPNASSAWTKMYAMFIYQRDTFLTRYHGRSNVETTFSMIKRKFGDSLRSKSDVGQMNEILCKVIAHNLCVLIACMYEIGMPEPEFAAVG